LLKGPPATERKVQYAKLKRLVEPGEKDLDTAFARLAEMLQSSGEVAEAQFDIVRGRSRQQWTLALEPKGAVASSRAARRPDLRVMVTADTARQILDGELSPLDAFLSGNLRIRGDTELAKRLLKRVAGRGETDICC
jgi:putative sterol carrier protein